MKVDLSVEQVSDRSLSVNGSFRDTLCRLSNHRDRPYVVLRVPDDDRCRVYCWDNENVPFRPTRLVKIKFNERVFALVSDDGAFTERTVWLSKDCPGIGYEKLSDFMVDGTLHSTAYGRLCENHCVGIVLPFCECCRARRASPGYVFCDDCNSLRHLMVHYFPACSFSLPCCVSVGSCGSSCSSCVLTNDCPVCVKGGCPIRKADYPEGFSTDRPYYNLFEIVPTSCIVKILQFMWLPDLVFDYLLDFNRSSRKGTVLNLTLNFKERYTFTSCGGANLRYYATDRYRLSECYTWLNPYLRTFIFDSKDLLDTSGDLPDTYQAVHGSKGDVLDMGSVVENRYHTAKVPVGFVVSVRDAVNCVTVSHRTKNHCNGPRSTFSEMKVFSGDVCDDFQSHGSSSSDDSSESNGTDYSEDGDSIFSGDSTITIVNSD